MAALWLQGERSQQERRMRTWCLGADLRDRSQEGSEGQVPSGEKENCANSPGKGVRWGRGEKSDLQEGFSLPMLSQRDGPC